MKKVLKILCLIMSLLIVSTAFYGCGKQKDDTLVKIRLNEVVRSIFYAPMYAAINNGYFKDEGIEIELSTGQGADKTMQQVLSGNADIGFCGPEQVIYLYNQGRDDYAVLFAQLTKRDGSFLVGRTKEDNFQWESLKGKTVIGGRPGGVPEMSFEYVLRNHGLTPGKDVNIITNLAFTATATAFKSGTGDYVTLFEPTASMLQKDASGYVVASIGKASGEIPYTCFFSTKSYMEKNPDIIKKFTRAIYRGQLWVEKSKSEDVAKAVISFFPGSDIDVLTMVVDRYKAQDTWNKTPELKEESLSRLMDVIQSYKADLIPKRPPFTDIVNNKFAEDAVKNIK